MAGDAKDRNAAVKDRFTTMLRTWIDQFAHTMQNTDTKEYLQVLVLDPFLKYMMNRIFPYMLIVLCLFAILIIFVILTFFLLLLRPSSNTMNASTIAPCPFCVGRA
jgi:sensor histidine kinase YesM